MVAPEALLLNGSEQGQLGKMKARRDIVVGELMACKQKPKRQRGLRPRRKPGGSV
jgi:hypothetical protein